MDLQRGKGTDGLTDSSSQRNTGEKAVYCHPPWRIQVRNVYRSVEFLPYSMAPAATETVRKVLQRGADISQVKALLEEMEKVLLSFCQRF